MNFYFIVIILFSLSNTANLLNNYKYWIIKMTTIDYVAESSERPLVTVVMSHWNNLLYIREALDSIAAQTFLDAIGDFEVRVFDDGSPEHRLKSLV